MEKLLRILSEKNGINNLKDLKQVLDLDNADKRYDQQRHMVWFNLFSAILYPFLIIFSDFLNLKHAASLLADIAPTYFISIMVIVIMFFGGTPIISKIIDKLERSKRPPENP